MLTPKGIHGHEDPHFWAAAGCLPLGVVAAAGVLREIKQEQNPRGREHAANEHAEADVVEEQSVATLEMRAAAAAAGSSAPSAPPPAPSSGDNGKPVAARVYFGMQQQYGNRAVQRILDPTVQRAPDGDAPADEAVSTIPPVEAANEQTNMACDDPARPSAPSPFNLQMAGPDIGTGRNKLQVMFDLTVRPRVARGPRQGGPAAADNIAGSFAIGKTATTKGGVTVSQGFGYAEPKFTAPNPQWQVLGKMVWIRADIDVEVHWDVRDNGKTNISSATDAAITKDEWPKVADDLDPAKGNGSNNPKRETYWNQSFTEKHEQFHATDYVSMATSAIATARAWLNANTIGLPSDGDRDSLHSFVEGKVKELVQGAVDQLATEVHKRFNAGGEDRAYAAGASDYKTLSDAIRERAKTEGWDPPGADTSAEGDAAAAPAT